MKYSTSKDFDVLIRQLVRSGWSYSRGRKHGKLHSPLGRLITVACSPSDHRAVKNLRQLVRSVEGWAR
jgi:predicted RNA binding protein YcfA (HicA-like mRNA interferase family)